MVCYRNILQRNWGNVHELIFQTLYRNNMFAKIVLVTWMICKLELKDLLQVMGQISWYCFRFTKWILGARVGIGLGPTYCLLPKLFHILSRDLRDIVWLLFIVQCRLSNNCTMYNVYYYNLLWRTGSQGPKYSVCCLIKIKTICFNLLNIEGIFLFTSI